jgi:uroporphyrinogen decarboxylase
MNSRERVSKAINYQKPDRVPIDLGGIRASGINSRSYAQLKQRMGIDTPTKIHDVMQLLAEIEVEVLDRLHIDVVPLDAGTVAWDMMDASQGIEKTVFGDTKVFFPPNTRITEEPDGSWFLRDDAGAPFAAMPKDGHYFDFIRTTTGGNQIDPALFKPKDTLTDEELEAISRRSKYLYENTDKAILGWGTNISMVGLSALLSDNITQGSLDEWLYMLIAEKETANEMMGRYVDAVISCMKLYHQATGDRCLIWGIASDDAGTQRGGLIAPDLFGEMVAPHYKRLCSWVHANTPWKTFVHSCGSVYDYIPYWIDAGVDILNPIQISAANMEPERLKREFGGKIVFWGGGCDTQRVLPLGTRDEIREHVRHNMEIFGRDGGFVFTQVHNIQKNVPIENIEAMFEAAYDFGTE